MGDERTGEITRLLSEIKGGDPCAQSRLFSLVYDDFRGLARKYMRHERAGHTLQPTALVHEAYIRLVRNHAPDWQDRTHFFATASLIMRHILVEHARNRGGRKAEGGPENGGERLPGVRQPAPRSLADAR